VQRITMGAAHLAAPAATDRSIARRR
jgi:hypothetical protein